MRGVECVFLAAVGDVLVDRPDPTGALSGVRPLLAGADLVFGNFEGCHDRRPPGGAGRV
jgi:hypothetical protein